ncbi:uncharacterized protein LOC124542814 [Vanessa cardui]|uniref:uncharacterized protein LOC124542814 n=1 Tax=Vanessa cardui TaxID=171605 RepID=UPI001F12B02C|nr:uncharacterized protein LOC124542814 [Vanessa cardui]
MKYLGLVLDGRWSFEEHFKLLVPRIEKAVGALHRLLPNLGRPREVIRRLYAGVVRSMALYGAPVWSHRLTGTRRCKTKILSLQRRVAIRMVRGYRTISFEAATLLACFPPLDILAERDSRVYDQTRALRQSGGSASYPASVLEALRRQEQRRAHTTWYARLRGDRYAHKRVVSAILPAFEAWMRRKRRVTFRLTQVLTGYGHVI